MQFNTPKDFFSGLAHFIWRSILSHANRIMVSPAHVIPAGLTPARVDGDVYLTNAICKRILFNTIIFVSFPIKMKTI